MGSLSGYFPSTSVDCAGRKTPWLSGTTAVPSIMLSQTSFPNVVWLNVLPFAETVLSDWATREPSKRSLVRTDVPNKTAHYTSTISIAG